MTDVILVGHSMGGLLAAEVVLMVCYFFFVIVQPG
jgi:surfactin synthase thioesterase subunit